MELTIADFAATDREWSTTGSADVDPRRGSEGEGECFIKQRDTIAPSLAPIGTPSNFPSTTPSLAPLWTQCEPEIFADLNDDLNFQFSCIRTYFELTSATFQQDQYTVSFHFLKFTLAISHEIFHFEICDCISHWDEAIADKYHCSTPDFPQLSIYNMWERCEAGLPTQSPSVIPTLQPSVAPDVSSCTHDQMYEMTFQSS